MSLLKSTIKKLFVFYNYFCFVLIFLIFFPLIYFFSRKPSRYINLNKVRKIWAYIGCTLSGIFIEKEFEISPPYTHSGTGKNNSKDSVIYCSNHASFLDILVMSQIADGGFFYLGKISLLKNPVLRIFFKTVDIAFDRESKTDSYRAFKQAGENLKEGRSLIIFPEGSMTANPPKLRPFKSGAFKLAIELGVPIVPVTIINSWEIFYGQGQNGGSPGILKCFIHKSINTINYTHLQEDELKNKVFSVIQNKLNSSLESQSLPQDWTQKPAIL